MTNPIRTALDEAYHPRLTAELLTAYDEAKRNFRLGKHRFSEVEGGRFCEAAYRILQLRVGKAFTAIGEQLDSDRLSAELARIPRADQPKSVRVYIPRALRVVYDIRNSRNAAHLGDGIDPGLQDATLVVAVLDWVLAEFIRLSGRIPPEEAQRLIEGLVTREVPVIQEFGRVPMVLRADLRAGDHVLLLLYHVAPVPVAVSELAQWVPATMVKNLRRTLTTLQTKALVRLADGHAQITYAGQRHIDARNLLTPPERA
ncbi:hypothetical protein ACQP2F_28085 [Actinoplanes sp. CA-030573]|uniref:hypothetical protein n=1 Tax=Actinoplanes sp. CA-030573 TaxID=3239898 RepID=UPI003D8FEBCB